MVHCVHGNLTPPPPEVVEHNFSCTSACNWRSKPLVLVCCVDVCVSLSIVCVSFLTALSSAGS